jgi:hypothetical protein
MVDLMFFKMKLTALNLISNKARQKASLVARKMHHGGVERMTA